MKMEYKLGLLRCLAAWSPSYPSLPLVVPLHSQGQRSSHGLGGGWSNGHAGYFQDDEELSNVLDSPPSHSSSPPASQPFQDIYAHEFLPAVDQFPAVPMLENAHGDSSSSYPAFYRHAAPFRYSTLPNPSMPHWHCESTSTSRAMTLPVVSRATHLIHSPSMDLSASILLSEVPTYGADPLLSPQDGTLRTSADELVSHAMAAFSGPSDHVAACLPSSHSVVDDAPQPSEGAEVPILDVDPTPSISSKHISQRKHDLWCRESSSTTQGRDPRPTSPRFCARLSEGTSVSYGDGLGLDQVKLAKSASLLADYDNLAFPSQTFGQKASFWLHCDGYMPFTRQLRVLSCGRQPTKRRLAQVTVRFVEYFIKDCEKHGQPFGFSLENIVLRHIDVVSRSAIRPVLDFVVPTV